jgi:hypothetical protein
MLVAAPSITVGQDQLIVVYDHNPMALLATMARLVKARDPYGLVPPAAIHVDSLASRTLTAISIGDVHAEVVRRAVERVDTPPSPAPDPTKPATPVSKSLSEDMVSFAQWLTVGPAISLPRGFLFRQVKTRSGQFVPSADRTPIIAALDDLASSANTQPAAWPSADYAKKLATLTLWCSFERIRAKTYYSGSIDAIPLGAPKERYAEVLRVRRILALLAALEDATNTGALRETAAWLMSPAIAPMFEYAKPELKEEMADLTTQILRIKVHPWIAEAERMRLIARRYTEWGASSTTIGLARAGLFAELSKVASIRGVGDSTVVDVRGDLLAFVIPGFIEQARELLQRRAMLDPTDLSQAEDVLGLTTPGSAPNLHLHGSTWKPIVMTGDMSSESVPDILTLLTRPRLPRKTRGQDPKSATKEVLLNGNVDAFNYVANFWETGTNGTVVTHNLLNRPTNQPPLFVEPEQPIVSDGYTLYQITIEMLKPMVPGEYFGDDDITDEPYSVDGVARLLGYDGKEALLMVETMKEKLLALLFDDGGTKGLLPKAKWPGATRLFHSSRTRKPWLVAVNLAEKAMPTKVIALDARTVPIQGDIQAVVFRTPDLPSLISSTLPLADDAASKAVASLGVTK